MEEVLRSLGMETVLGRFQAQRMEPHAVLAASDQELVRLGVSTIGDRIRLRDACKRKVDENDASTSQASAAREERLAIFNPRRHNSRTQARAAARATSGASRSRVVKSRPWTPTFFCLADSTASKTPSATEKQILFKAGLGLKKIKLDLEDDEQRVIQKITCATQDATGNPTGFPQLKTCGGFELMRCTSNCRDLTTITCSWNAKDLRSSLGGGQGKIYLRPIQKSLSTQALVEQSQCEVKEKCHMCDKEILVRKLRDHLWSCTEGLDSDDDNLNSDNGTTLDDSPSTSLATSSANSSNNAETVETTLPNATISSSSTISHRQSQQSSSAPPRASHQSSSVLPRALQQSATPPRASQQSSSTPPGPSHQLSSSTPSRASQQSPTSPRASQQSSSIPPNTSQQSSESSSSDPTSVFHQSSSDPPGLPSAPPSISIVDLTQTTEVDANNYTRQTVDEVVNEIVAFCKENAVVSHVEILRCLQQKMVTGRALEVENVAQAIEGETNYINVDRHNLMETSFEEIMFLEEYRTTLQVQFYGEVAEDYGGPRKEFFRLVLAEIKDTYFDKGLRELLREKYVAIGIILGLSIMQNGKVPRFLNEDVQKKVFTSEASSESCIAELQEGFKKVGIYQLGCMLPTFLDIFKRPPYTLTVRSLISLLNPKFCEEGSNKRRFENEISEMHHNGV